MEEYEKLTEDQKKIVNKYIQDNIDSVYDERKAYGTCIEEHSSGSEITDSDEIKDEFVESTFVGYYCKECSDYVINEYGDFEVDDDKLILHVIEHIKENDDKCLTCKHLGKSVFNSYPPECYICDDCNEENEFIHYERVW